MGHWSTLHLFDDQKFIRELVPLFRGEKQNLIVNYTDFLKTHITGGISHLTKVELDNLINIHLGRIIEISKLFNDSFKTHSKFHKLTDHNDKVNFFEKLEGYYDFCKFFEYSIFKNYSDFFPHIPLGKAGISQDFNLKPNTISQSILNELDSWNEFFSFNTRS